jgi:hypothetical protein
MKIFYELRKQMFGIEKEDNFWMLAILSADT